MRIFIRKPGFTLIELLVVVAIIALLLSIVTPALNRARGSAREIVCKSHLRQVCIASMVYAQENKDWWPSQVSEFVHYAITPLEKIPSGGGNGESWARKILPYVSGDTSVFYCPVARIDSVNGAGWSAELEQYTISYVANGAGTVIKRSAFDQPANKIFSQDVGLRYLGAWLRVAPAENTWNDAYADWPNPAYSLQYPDVPSCLKALGMDDRYSWNRHQHGARKWGRSVVYMDGHVEWREWGVFLDSYLPARELNRIRYIKPTK